MSERDSERYEFEAPVVEEVVSIGKSMGLEMDEGDIKELQGCDRYNRRSTWWFCRKIVDEV